MKLLDLKDVTLEPINADHEIIPKLMQITTPKKRQKALKEFIDNCNNIGFVPVNPHSRWNRKEKVTEVIAYAVYMGVNNAKKVKTLERTTN